ncbi:MAG: nucleotidyltransferase family protein [Acidobacteriota bacterium]|nr:nucleotidyltransferase family protein [Acidobacteriota bacterium]
MAENLRLDEAEPSRELVALCTRSAGAAPTDPETDSQVFAQIANLAVGEGLAPLLGARLAAGEIAAPTDSESRALSQELQERYRTAARVGAARALGAEVLQRSLARRRIPALLLKGAALVATVYRDPGRRTMGDVDLLVPPERWQEALEAARNAGAQVVEAPQRPVSLRHFHEVHLVLPGGGLGDLHRRLTPWPLFTPDLPQLFQRARPLPGAAESDSTGAWLPAPEDLLLSLVVHAAKDGFQLPLRAVVDGLRLLAVATPDPQVVEARARAWHARRATARWLQMLGTFDDLGKDWQELPGRLAPKLGPLPPGFLQPPPSDLRALGARWSMRRRQAQVLDDRWRAVAYAGATALFFLGDLVQGKRS